MNDADILDWMREEIQKRQQDGDTVTAEKLRLVRTRLGFLADANRQLVGILDRQNQRLQRSYERNRVNEAHMARLDAMLKEVGK